MYSLPYFEAENENEVTDFMQQHPFITLTGIDANNYPVATHVPVLFEEQEGKIFLLGHIMKQSDHHKAFLQNNNVLAIFTGSHTYVSASWYKDQQQGSTWNYQAVHAKGKLQLLNEEALLHVLHRLTEYFENNASSPSLVEHLSADYIERLIKAIVAFKIEVTEITHVFKLSQNRDKESYQNIIEHLKKGNCEAQNVAAAMEKNKKA